MIFSKASVSQAEMTICDMLHDPLIRTVLRADGVSLACFARILEDAARNLTASKEARIAMGCPASAPLPDIEAALRAPKRGEPMTHLSDLFAS